MVAAGRKLIKRNVDGASSDDGSVAGCGGVIRDATGRWILGFTMNLGRLDSLSTELWSIIVGLHFAWKEGHRRVCLESDSREAVALARQGCSTKHPLSMLVQQLRVLIIGDWEVNLQVNCREGNEIANWLAAVALGSDSGLIVLEALPEKIIPILQKDMGLEVK